jgi:hypothetical protein
VDSIKIKGKLLNNDAAVDLTGSTVTINVATPNKTNVSQTCTITNALAGEFEVILDETAYANLGEHRAQFRYTKGTEVNITDQFYFESVDAIPI